MHSVADGGWSFAADPHRRFDAQPIFWAPETLPAVLAIDDAVPPSLTASIDFSDVPIEYRRAASDGWHVVLNRGGAMHRLWLKTEPVKLVSFAVRLPLDDDLGMRLRATERLQRALAGQPLGPALEKLTPLQRAQLVMGLRALDAHLDGASYRVIAEALFGAARVPARGWKTHDLRSRTIRLVKSALELMRGGYRELLRPRQRKR